MKTIDLNNVKLFDPLTEITSTENYFDLHNDYSCNEMNFDFKGGRLMFSFSSDQPRVNYNRLNLVLQSFRIVEIKINGPAAIAELTLDNFYRGSYTLSNQSENPNSELLFYHIEFYEEVSLDVLCSRCYIEIL